MLRRLGEVLLHPTAFLQAVVCLTDLEGTDWASYSVLRWLELVTLLKSSQTSYLSMKRLQCSDVILITCPQCLGFKMGADVSISQTVLEESP